MAGHHNYVVNGTHIRLLTKQILAGETEDSWGVSVVASQLFEESKIMPALTFLRLEGTGCDRILEAIGRTGWSSHPEESRIVLCGMKESITTGNDYVQGYGYIYVSLPGQGVDCPKFLVTPEMLEIILEAFVIAGLPICDVNNKPYFRYD